MVVSAGAEDGWKKAEKTGNARISKRTQKHSRVQGHIHLGRNRKVPAEKSDRQVFVISSRSPSASNGNDWKSGMNS